MARGHCVIFDECGFLDADMMHTYAAFVIVSKGFATGKDRDGNRIDMNRLRCIPDQIPNSLFYISSASSTDTEFYRLFRDFSKRMLIGDMDYFVACIDCEIVLHPTLHGKEIAPLYSKTTIDATMRNNPEKGRREYYCQFTTEAGEDAVFKRGVITRNEETRKPLLYNDTGDKKFVISYDPARSRDLSVILVTEIYDAILANGTTEKRARLVNCINMIDIGKKIKSPMQTPDQIDYLRQIILDYNGGAEAYGNIIGVYIDAGSGGGGVNIADYLMQDWVDKSGTTHRGLIDKEYSADYIRKFPNAVDKVRLISPAAFKSIMYEAAIELTNQNKISFTSNYDNKGYLTVFDVDQKKLDKARKEIADKLKKEKLSEQDFEEKLNDELSKIQSVNTKMIKLDWKDELALANIDALKEELVNIVRKKRDSGKDSFELTPEKARVLHDDRAYVYVLACYALMELRRKQVLSKPKASSSDLKKFLSIRAPKSSALYNR